jgi:hypothetical protein
MSAWRIFYGGATMLMAIGIALTFLGDKGHLVKWFALNRTPLADLYFYHVTKLGEEYGFVVIGLILWLRSWRRMIAHSCAWLIGDTDELCTQKVLSPGKAIVVSQANRMGRPHGRP